MTAESSKILIVDDEAELAQALATLLGHAGYTCAVCTDDAGAYERVLAEAPDLVLTDHRMPRVNGLDLMKRVRTIRPTLPVVLLTAFATVDIAVEAMREGAADVLAKPFLPEDLLAKIRGALERGRQQEPIRAPSGRPSRTPWEMMAVSHNPQMRSILAMAEQTAATDSRVLITGESGTGKELLARLIHRLSLRRDRGFFPANCAALSESLLESELFGHERGAFTGAVSTRRGIFEVASDGTLFLDEIASTSGAFQAKLLRAVETGEFARVGAAQPLRTHARLIAATNSDLQQAVEAGTFRADLFYRLRVVQFHLPPLRERPEDIPRLAEHLLQLHATRLHKPVASISDEGLQALVRYRWPGNIRELENVLERAVIVAVGDRVTLRDLPAELGSSTPVAPSGGPRVMEGMERALIEKALAESGWNKSRAARRLGIGRRTLYSKAARYGIPLNPDDERK